MVLAGVGVHHRGHWRPVAVLMVVVGAVTRLVPDKCTSTWYSVLLLATLYLTAQHYLPELCPRRGRTVALQHGRHGRAVAVVRRPPGLELCTLWSAHAALDSGYTATL